MASTQSLGAYFGGISGPGIALRETTVCPKEPRGKPPCKRAHTPLTPKPNLGIVIFKKSGFSSPTITAMKDLEVDVALLPVCGTYVMTTDQAVKAALDINPELATPIITARLWEMRGTRSILRRRLKGRLM